MTTAASLFPLGMACIGLACATLLIVLFVIRELERIGRDIDEDRN